MDRQLIEVKDLRIEYRTDIGVAKAVNGIDFSINKGETLGIVGETGAGKTTTALGIMRLLPERTGVIAGGEILFDGQDLVKKKEREMMKIRGKEISMIFQDPMTSLNPVIPIGEQIAEGLILHTKMTEKQISDRVDEMLELVGIPASRKNEYPYQFSGGMRQRVVIAMALACNPQLLIADEPTTALDVTIQAQVIDMMEDLKKKLNTSIIMITHDLGIVAQTCDRVAIMYAGELVESGTVKDIFKAETHHPYTVGLFGSIPNIKEDVKRLNPIKGDTPDPMRLPSGCKFHPRCPKRMDICEKEEPIDLNSGSHIIRCHLYQKGI